MIFIAGASGFAGSHLTDSLAAKGLRFKCIARSQSSSDSLSKKCAEVISGDITDASSLSGALSSEDMVIHLVGIMEENGASTFRNVHVDGTRNLVDEAVRAGVKHFFYQSALGADRNSWSDYLRTKEEAEDIVRQSGLPYTIFRPSLIIGPWDGFTKKLVDIIKLSPVIPIPGNGMARFQPVYVKDWVRCLEKVIEKPEDFSGSFDIAGPEHLTYKEIVSELAKALGSLKPFVSLPLGFMKFSVGFFETITIKMPVSRDQLRLLEQDNISSLDAIERHFGFSPMRFSSSLSEFVRKK